jgi:hypothetical protein
LPTSTSPLAFTLTLTDDREIVTLRDASLFFATLTPEQREESHWSIAIRMLGNALKQPTNLRAATISLQTALVVETLLASPLTIGGG